MKKIAVWKVLVLSIVTAGIYTIIWLARRRNELVENYGQKVPHWLWILLPSLIALVLFFPLIIVLALLVKDPALLAASATWGSVALFVVPFIISIWWITKFSQAAARVVANRVPAGWAVFLYILCGFFTSGVQQFFFNRYAKKTLPKEQVGPSVRFVILSSIAITVSLIVNIWSFTTFPGDYEQLKVDLTHNAELLEKVNRLATEYDACIEKLERDHPGDLTAENEAAYNQAYDACEEIRIEQNKAADEYNRL